MKENQSYDKYLELAEKWMAGTITAEEEKEYAEWYNTIDPNASVIIPSALAASKEEHHKKILNQINSRRFPVVQMRPRFMRIAAAVTIGFIIGIACMYFFSRDKSTPTIVKNQKQIVPVDIKPGTNGAILTLANGKTIVLDTASNGKLDDVGTADITKSSTTLNFASTGEKSGETEYNTLITPRAKQQQLVLADGSQVWLDAESSIKFPTSFKGNQRTVEITGEAYFEVAKDAHKPFIVRVNNATVEVLGTHFNIMAYNNEGILKTTLLEGSVKFSKGNGSVLLKPGEQSQLLQNDKINLIKDADVELAVAWKNGKQAFEGADIKTVLRQVERWYDVDVEYIGEIPFRTFTGDIPRTANLSELIKLLEVNKIHATLDAAQKKLIVER